MSTRENYKSGLVFIFSQHCDAASNFCHACVVLALFCSAGYGIVDCGIESKNLIYFLVFFSNFNLLVVQYFISTVGRGKNSKEYGKFFAKAEFITSKIEALVKSCTGECSEPR